MRSNTQTMDTNPSKSAPKPIFGRSLPVPQSLTAKYQEGARSWDIKIQSLSRGGICIRHNTAIPVGATVRLLLHLKEKRTEAQGEVVWNAKEGPSYLHGIKFTFMKQEGREWFHTFAMDWAAEQIAEDLDFSSLTQPEAQHTFERRSFARLKIPLKIEFGFNEDTMLVETHIYDLSEGGLCLISQFEMKQDQELMFRLWLNEGYFVRLTGAVRYCVKKIYDNKMVNFHGVEFKKVSKESSIEINRFLAKTRSQMAAIEITLDDIIGLTNPSQLP